MHVGGSDDLELDQSPGAPAALEVPDVETQYELDDGAAPTAPRARPEPTAPAQADPIAEAREIAQHAARRSDMALAAIAPYLTHLQRQAMGTPKARIEIDTILKDPNVTTEQLVGYVQQTLDERLTQQQQLSEMTARRASSEQYVRGLFTGDGFSGRDLDAMRNKFIAPIQERVPYIRDVLTALNPEQPALIEYGLAALMEMSAQAKDDPVAFYRSLFQFLDGRGEDHGDKIQKAAEAAASRVASGSSTGRQTRGGLRTVRAGKAEIEGMSDKAFDQLDRQLTGGL